MCYNAGIEMINPLGGAFPVFAQVNAMARPVSPVRTPALRDRFVPMRWLLIPPGITRSTEIAGLKIWLANARIEELEEKPLFRPLLRENRCIVRFSWFFEWRREPGNSKTKYRVALPDREPMLLPGLYREATIDGAPYPAFTVCTMEARGVMRYVHNHRLRQPVVVDTAGAAAWLDPALEIVAARREVLDHERSREFVPDPPLQADLFGDAGTP